MLMGIIIGVIAAAILIYFSFFSGKKVPVPEIIDETAEETVINAEVTNKRVVKSGSKRGHLLYFYVEFECEDGEYRELSVGPDVYKALDIGMRDILIYTGDRFAGFGDYGAIDDSDGIEAEDDGFTYDDYDESIDVERDIQTIADDGFSKEERETLTRFRNRERLPAKTETIEDETAELLEYSVLSLLEKTTSYPFLKLESDVRRLFERTFKEALDDMLGYAGNSRKGVSADSIVANKNEIRVAITVEENPKPLMSKITAEFGVND